MNMSLTMSRKRTHQGSGRIERTALCSRSALKEKWQGYKSLPLNIREKARFLPQKTIVVKHVVVPDFDPILSKK